MGGEGVTYGLTDNVQNHVFRIVAQFLKISARAKMDVIDKAPIWAVRRDWQRFPLPSFLSLLTPD